MRSHFWIKAKDYFDDKRILFTKDKVRNFLTAVSFIFVFAQSGINTFAYYWYRSDELAEKDTVSCLQRSISDAATKSALALTTSATAATESALALTNSATAESRSAEALETSAKAQSEATTALKTSASAQIDSAKAQDTSAKAQTDLSLTQGKIFEFYGRYENKLDQVMEYQKNADTFQKDTNHFQKSMLETAKSGSGLADIGGVDGVTENFYERLFTVLHILSWSPQKCGNMTADYRQLENDVVLRDGLTHQQILSLVGIACSVDKDARSRLEAIPKQDRETSKGMFAVLAARTETFSNLMPAAFYFSTLERSGSQHDGSFRSLMLDCIAVGIDTKPECGWQCVKDTFDGRTPVQSDVALFSSALVKHSTSKQSVVYCISAFNDVTSSPSVGSSDLSLLSNSELVQKLVEKKLQTLQIRQTARIERFGN